MGPETDAPGAPDEGDGCDADGSCPPAPCPPELCPPCQGLLGAGTDEDPFIVSCCEELEALGELPGASFALAGDIECRASDPADPANAGSAFSGRSFAPISGPFRGRLDGRGHAIRRLTIERSGEPAGLFETLAGPATVTDLRLVQVRVKGGAPVGAVAGRLLLEEASAPLLREVEVEGSVEGSHRTGGLAGESRGATLLHCSFAGEVRGGLSTGGLVGDAGEGIGTPPLPAVVSRSFAVGRVVGTLGTGGLVGTQVGAFLEDGYSTAEVEGTSGVGGLVGVAGGGGDVRRTYFAGKVSGKDAIGGLVGHFAGTSAGGLGSSFSVGAILSKMGFAVVGRVASPGLEHLFYDPAAAKKAACHPLGEQGCTAVDSGGSGGANFSEPTQPPLAAWSFAAVWQATPGGLPTLRPMCEPDCCVPACLGKQCGDDGCGAACGQCAGGEACDADGRCPTPPTCFAACGLQALAGCYCDLACEGYGDCCSDYFALCKQGCAADCEGKACGNDGCGGSCGECAPGTGCTSGQCLPASCAGACGGQSSAGCWCDDACVGYGDCCSDYEAQCKCTPSCGEGSCGPDGCTGSCGECAAGSACVLGKCEAESCEGHCGGKAPTGCFCDGACADHGDCCPDYTGACPPPCVPDCGGSSCGPDGCGGTCPPGCSEAQTCQEGACVPAE